MRLAFLGCLVCLFFIGNPYATKPGPAAANIYNVRIEMVDIYDHPFKGFNGLNGFWAVDPFSDATYKAKHQSHEIYDLFPGTINSALTLVTGMAWYPRLLH